MGIADMIIYERLGSFVFYPYVMPPLKQVNRNGMMWVTGASPFKPPTMSQGGTYFNSIKVYKSKGGGVKNWYSSSDVTAHKRNMAIGKNATRLGLKNGQPSQYRSNDRAVRNSAVARVRGGGAVAPAKKGAYQRY